MLANNQLDLAGKEIAKKLVQRCLHIVEQDSPKPVASRSEWVHLFDASHSLEEFEALLVNGKLDENPQMSVVDMSKDAGRSLHGSGQSARLRRCLEDYAAHLRRLFAVTKELVFIDPYLSCKGNYRDFPHLLAAIPARSEAPRIKLHRQAKPNHKENCLWKHEWEEHFAPLGEVLRQKNLKAEVLIWGRFHNRYLLHSFGGRHLGHGFETSPAPDDEEPATWSRMSPNACDDIRKEFSENSPYHNLCHRFEIGA